MNVEEASCRFFNTRNTEPKQQTRNPITQIGIPDKQLGEPSPGNPRGPGRTDYSNKAQGSFKLAYRPSEMQPPPTRNNKDFHNNRNPITQETDPNPNTRPSIERGQKFDKYYKSNIFEVGQQPLSSPLKNRSNQKFQSSKIFEGEEPIYRPLSKKVPNKSTEIEKLFSHDGKDMKGIAEKPNTARMNSAEFGRNRKEVDQMAKVYNARRNISNITFS